MASLPVMEGDGRSPEATGRRTTSPQSRATSLHFLARTGSDSIRNLQDRAPAHAVIAQTQRISSPNLSAHLPPHDCRPPLGSGGRSQRHPWLAGPCEPGNHEPLRRDQSPDEGGSPAGVPTTCFCFFARVSPKAHLERRRGTVEMAQISV